VQPDRVTLKKVKQALQDQNVPFWGKKAMETQAKWQGSASDSKNGISDGAMMQQVKEYGDIESPLSPIVPSPNAMTPQGHAQQGQSMVTQAKWQGSASDHGISDGAIQSFEEYLQRRWTKKL
jgi:hypothetical protein